MGGLSNRKVVDCTQQEMLMFHCSVWLRIVLMVQLIVCTVWGLNKEKHLTAELMKVSPKRPQCAHCGFSQSGHLCQALPLASSYLSEWHGDPFFGTLWRENCSRPNMAQSPEHHVDPWRLKVRVDVTGSGLLSLLKLWHGTEAGHSRTALDCMHLSRGCGLTVSDRKIKFRQTCTPMCKKRHKHTSKNPKCEHVKDFWLRMEDMMNDMPKKGKALVCLMCLILVRIQNLGSLWHTKSIMGRGFPEGSVTQQQVEAH